MTSDRLQWVSDSAGLVLITGANRGIGREVARQMAQRGYQVILSARDAAKADAAAAELAKQTSGSVNSLELDVADPTSITRAAEHVKSRWGRLDVLINNAGVGSDFGVSGTEPDFEKVQAALQMNFYGAYRLTVALLPLLHKRASADR